jgi:hypothetical protein
MTFDHRFLLGARMSELAGEAILNLVKAVALK